MPLITDGPSAALAEQYAIAVGERMEARLPHNSPEKVTILVDARGQDGWANPAPKELLTFFR